MTLVPCSHDSCPRWVSPGHGAHEGPPGGDGEETYYCAEHCPACDEREEVA